MRSLLVMMFALLFAVGCARPNRVNLVRETEGPKWDESYMKSGTIVLSRQIPPPSTQPSQYGSLAAEQLNSDGQTPQFGPLIGYIPPTLGLADNEVWLEIDSNAKTITVFKGQTKIQSLAAEGTVGLAPGNYALQHKQKRPLWYAPDTYFTKRNLPVPAAGDGERYRRGALGGLVLYPTTTFPIHSAPVWTDDVGGLRVSQADLASIYFMLPVGSTVVVK